ncbi:MAG TPA: SdrD B-like domain-containing protein, partial [Roseiflexaceae bacterium]|nr:SdrD B-like domain-containing protein [Roseiflexaceae bacterium]
MLAQGNYSLNGIAPAGYQLTTPLPQSVTVGATTTTRRLAARVAGGIAGAVIGPDGALGGTTVRLTNITTNQIYTTVAAYGCHGWCSDAFYQFANLPSGQYRLSMPTPPPGHVLAGEPLVNYTAGQTIQQQLVLHSLGYLSGVVYLDTNLNGQRDNGELPASGYTVTLLNDGGLPVRTAQPDANGVYLFTNLSAGVRYLVTVDLFVSQAASMSDSLSEAPEWFVPGMQPVQANIGIYQGGAEHSYNTVYGRVSHGGAGVAGIRIGYYAWAAGQGCQQSNPLWHNLETISDVNGDYKLLTHMLPGNGHTYCIAARGLVGYQQNNTPATGSNFSYTTTGAVTIYHAGYWQRDITLVPLTAQPVLLAKQAAAVVRWSAFRDDNLNGVWDANEPALPGVRLGGNASGVIGGLVRGAHQLALQAPAGYAPLHGNSVSFWLHDADVALPPLAFRFSGALYGQIFRDEDGDGWLRQGESSVSGVTVNLSGPVAAQAITDRQGRLRLPNLPNGSYTVSITPPNGYAAVAPRVVTLSNGGAISIALRPIGQISGVIYDDWDADGRRGADEPLIRTPLTVVVGGIAEQRTRLGIFRSWGIAPGNYTITSRWPAATQATGNPTTAGTVRLPAVPPGVVRGVVWLDINRDGVRQPWETPMAGVALTVAGQTITTDSDGRFAVYGIAPASYTLTA